MRLGVPNALLASIKMLAATAVLCAPCVVQGRMPLLLEPGSAQPARCARCIAYRAINALPSRHVANCRHGQENTSHRQDKVRVSYVAIPQKHMAPQPEGRMQSNPAYVHPLSSATLTALTGSWTANTVLLVRHVMGSISTRVRVLLLFLERTFTDCGCWSWGSRDMSSTDAGRINAVLPVIHTSLRTTARIFLLSTQPRSEML